MKAISSGLKTFNETGKYARATVAYGGLLSYSMLINGGGFLKWGLQKASKPLAAAACRPYDFVKDRSPYLFRKKEREERIDLLTRKLALIEERLAKLEKYGVVPGSDEHVIGKKKQLNEDKLFVLRQILEETKAVRDMG
jgi:hypothetical protein